MAKKTSDEVCLQNYENMKQLFMNVVPNSSRFEVVYGAGVDVGMTNFMVVRKTTYTYSSYAIGFDKVANELAILPISRTLDSYGEVIFIKSVEKKKAKTSFFSKEITIKANVFPKGYIQFTVQEVLNDDPEEIALCVKQNTQAKEFLTFFKEQFSK